MTIENTYVFCDIDGTLGMSGAEIPMRNRIAIERFVALGGNFGVCTERWTEEVRAFCSGLPINTLCVIGNGAGVYDYEHDHVKYYRTLPDVADDLYRDILANYPEYNGVVVSMARGHHHIGSPHEGGGRQYPVYETADNSPTVQYIFELPADEKVSTVVSRFNNQYVAHLDQVRFVPNDDHSIALLPVGVNKGVGMQKIAAELHIDMSQTVFIGNHYNDIEAFSAAGLSACMASTPVSLRFIPSYQLGEAMQGGVADLLNMLMRKTNQAGFMAHTG